MLLFDAHLDLAWNALEWNRDLMLSVEELNQFESNFEGIRPGAATVTWPALRAGNIGMMIATCLPRRHCKDAELSHYQSRDAAYAVCRSHIDYYRSLAAQGYLREITDVASLNEHVAAWETGIANGSTAELPLGYITSMEGSPGILSPSQIPEWYEFGLKILGPAHYGEAPYCFGTGSEGGLKPGGKELLQEMEKCGMLLDVTHLADQSFWEALDVYSGPVLASHHNSRTLVAGDRQLDDAQIKAIAERGAVIGLSFDAWMIKPGWKIRVSDPATVSIEDAVAHTDYICQLLGSAKHCGIGSDLDGGFGKEQCPHDLETIADLNKIAEILDRKGYSAEDIAGIMSGNFINFFRRAWA
jgi:membrane dipeptidase